MEPKLLQEFIVDNLSKPKQEKIIATHCNRKKYFAYDGSIDYKKARTIACC